MVKFEQEACIFDSLDTLYEFIENEIGKYARIEREPEVPGAASRRAISRQGRRITSRIEAVSFDGPPSGRSLQELTIFTTHGAVTIDQLALDNDCFRIHPEVLDA